MAIGDSYLSLAAFKARLGIATGDRDVSLQAALDAASRVIDGFCGRSFGRSATATVRYYPTTRRNPRFSEYAYGSALHVEDLVSVSELAIDVGGRTWATILDPTDYALYSTWDEAIGGPYDLIGMVSPIGWPYGPDAVKITAIWGWPAVPAAIEYATYLLANRNQALDKSPFGATGAGELGAGLNMTNALAPLIKETLAPYRVMTI